MERFDFLMERFSVGHGADVRLTASFREFTASFSNPTASFCDLTAAFPSPTAVDLESTIPFVPSVPFVPQSRFFLHLTFTCDSLVKMAPQSLPYEHLNFN